MGMPLLSVGFSNTIPIIQNAQGFFPTDGWLYVMIAMFTFVAALFLFNLILYVLPLVNKRRYRG